MKQRTKYSLGGGSGGNKPHQKRWWEKERLFHKILTEVRFLENDLLIDSLVKSIKVLHVNRAPTEQLYTHLFRVENKPGKQES